jgi:hypothetical protein
MRLDTALCAIALILSSAPSPAAELYYLDHDAVTGEYVGPVGPLVLSGEIIPGDRDRLLSKIADNETRFLAQNKLMLASDGGDVAEALKIAVLIKSLYTEVIVGAVTGGCVSACFFIYAAAHQREADGAGLIGINRPFLADDVMPARQTGTAMADTQGLSQVRAFLRENAVPEYLVREMLQHDSTDAYWLSTDDEKNLGFRSQEFSRYLKAKCAWDDAVERNVYAGKRPIEDLKQMLTCRDRVTQGDAHKALAAALAAARAAPGRPAPGWPAPVKATP